jgi:hypothetical protein
VKAALSRSPISYSSNNRPMRWRTRSTAFLNLRRAVGDGHLVQPRGASQLPDLQRSVRPGLPELLPETPGILGATSFEHPRMHWHERLVDPRLRCPRSVEALYRMYDGTLPLLGETHQELLMNRLELTVAPVPASSAYGGLANLQRCVRGAAVLGGTDTLALSSSSPPRGVPEGNRSGSEASKTQQAPARIRGRTAVAADGPRTKSR